MDGDPSEVQRSQWYGGRDGSVPLIPADQITWLRGGVPAWAGIGTCSPGHHDPGCEHIPHAGGPAEDDMLSTIREAHAESVRRRREAIAHLRELERLAQDAPSVVLTGQSLSALLFLITGE